MVLGQLRRSWSFLLQAPLFLLGINVTFLAVHGLSIWIASLPTLYLYSLAFAAYLLMKRFMKKCSHRANDATRVQTIRRPIVG